MEVVFCCCMCSSLGTSSLTIAVFYSRFFWLYKTTTKSEKITFSKKVMLRLPFVACTLMGVLTSNRHHNSVVAAACAILVLFYFSLQLYHAEKLKFTKVYDTPLFSFVFLMIPICRQLCSACVCAISVGCCSSIF